MARFEKGWVKIYRAAILGDIGSNFTRLGLFGALVGIANLQPSTVVWNGKPRRIERGDMVTSLKELSELGSVDVKTVSRHLNYLQLRETIYVEKSTTGTFIRINNFEEYQGQDAESSTRHPNDMENDRDDGVQTTGIHIEESKNIRSKEVKNNNIISVAQNCASLVPVTKSVKDTISVKSFKDFDFILTPKVKTNFTILYPDYDFLKREFLKMDNWLESNPKKNQKTLRGWNQFVSNWLSTAWPKYQNSIPSNKASSTVLQADISDRIAKLFGEEIQDAS